MKNFIHVTTSEQFKLLYNSGKAAVYHGLKEQFFEDVLEQHPNAQGYVINGANLNQEYDLVGDVALPDDQMLLVIVPIEEADLEIGTKYFSDYINMLTTRSRVFENYYSQAR